MLHRININFLLFLKSIHITRNIEVEVVPLDFLEACQIGVFIDSFPGLIGRYDLINVRLPEPVLVLVVLILPARSLSVFLPFYIYWVKIA